MSFKFHTLRDPAVRPFIVERLVADVQLRRTSRVAAEAAYLLPVPPGEAAAARALVAAIATQDLPAQGVRTAVIDLYDLVLAYLDTEGIWEELCAAEAEDSVERGDLILMLEDVLDVRSVLAPQVEEAIERAQRQDGVELAFITGVGETFPYVRTHALLSDLDAAVPVVLVFPGSYWHNADGSTALEILDIRAPGIGGYYRATSVFDL